MGLGDLYQARRGAAELQGWAVEGWRSVIRLQHSFTASLHAGLGWHHGWEFGDGGSQSFGLTRDEWSCGISFTKMGNPCANSSGVFVVC